MILNMPKTNQKAQDLLYHSESMLMKMDDFASSSIESRVEDIHEAFSDKSVATT